jgi:hypothetical protein
MMTKMLQSSSAFIIFILFIACSNVISEDEKKRRTNELLLNFVISYNPQNEFVCYKENGQYKLGDSLNNFLTTLNPNEVAFDTCIRKSFLFFLEKRYLFLMQISNNSHEFYNYNVSTWVGDKTYTQYAINIFRKMPLLKDEDYEDYINKWVHA